MTRTTKGGLVIVVLVTAASLALLWTGGRSQQAAAFATWDGIGPDKWASVWLIRRHVDPSAAIRFLPPKTPVTDGVAFDVPTAALKRDATTTTFEQLIAAYGVEAAGLDRMAALINQIEILGWRVASFSAADRVEQGFRALQLRHGREQVPFTCYLAFFDRLYAQLEEADADAELTGSALATLLPPAECRLGRETPAARELLVPELSLRAVLAAIAAGDQVVFVDAREPAEFDEVHLPGAVNLRLRDVDSDRAAALRGADLVVPYCVKDFRGFEVARALQREGLERVAILNPYGLRGWQQSGLPVAGTRALSAADATRELAACVAAVDACLGSS